jgi:glycosyltransferase involved in cell wall biosynthesis
MRAAQNRGDDVCLLVPAEGSTADAARKEGFEVKVFPLQRTFHFHKAFQFALWLRRSQINLVHAHTTLPGKVLARVGAWLARVPIICHHHAVQNYNQSRVIRLMQRTADNLTAKISINLTVSEDTRRSLIASGNPAQNIRVLVNGVEPNSYKRNQISPDLKQTFNIPINCTIVGCIARLSLAKGQADLIRAMEYIVAEVQTAHLVLIGQDVATGGQYQSELVSLAAELGLADKVHFTGYRTDVLDLLHDIDIVVLPSYREAMPMSILEAMAAARPVVATHVNGVPEVVVDGVTGILVPPGDPVRLAGALLDLIRDPELRRQMGAAGYARVKEHFNLDRLHQRLFAIYDQVVEEHRGKNRR